jgi:hypothetical protein
MKMIDKEEKYVESLENLLIFMCKNYQKTWKVLMELHKEGNETWIKIPSIQRSCHTIPIAQLSKLEFKKPEHNFRYVYDKLYTSADELKID